ncbi:HAMP domain-containing histidine kinase [Maribius pontilimi]|uniref:histidine kinase n=1 Tax=Palleronia pontilimi TaxID=1964209 RepID=A0A934MGK1_9RHOB|nr:ATP-binding protein [Palleronia pontilimi]MBJ3762469.1 HAMP domain-containing histidine kinase [Palleronia pontilimi]
MLDLRKWRGADPFLSAVQSMSCPIFVVERTPEGVFQFVHFSPELEKATGFDADAVCAGPIETVFPARMAELIADNYRAALESDTPIYLDEAHRLNDAETWWRTVLARAPDGAQGRARIVGVTSEITDVKLRESRLVSDLADLKMAHREVQMLAGLTVHDMRAPLANVISLTGIVLEGFRDLGDGKRDMILACRDVARSSIAAIDGMMQRVMSDHSAPFREDEIDLYRSCADIAGLVDPGQRLTITYPRQVVLTDAIVLHATLRNLMENAVRYARSQIDITIDEDPVALTITLSVMDDGPGVDAAIDPIAKAARAKGGAKCGYGLPTILKLLKSQGGSLSYIRRKDKPGAIFRAELPGRIHELASPAKSA